MINRLNLAMDTVKVQIEVKNQCQELTTKILAINPKISKASYQVQENHRNQQSVSLSPTGIQVKILLNLLK